MSYAPTPLKNAAVIESPTITFADWPKNPLPIAAPEKIEANSELAIQGEMKFDDPKMAVGIVYLEFFQLQADGTHLITETSQVVSGNDDVRGDGVLRYRIEVHAPKTRGRQTFELKLHHPQLPESFVTFARGETVVQ